MTSFRGRRRAQHRMRLGLWFLTVAAALPGAWATIAPRSFFDDFPGLGLRWVVVFPPYNEHLVRDVGAFYLAFALLLAIAATSLGRTITRAALIVWIVFSGLHLLFHITHLGERPGGLAAVIALAVVLVLPLVLLTQLGRLDRAQLKV